MSCRQSTHRSPGTVVVVVVLSRSHAQAHHRRHVDVDTGNTHDTHVIRVSGLRYRTVGTQPSHAGRRWTGQQGSTDTPKTTKYPSEMGWGRVRQPLKNGDGMHFVVCCRSALVSLSYLFPRQVCPHFQARPMKLDRELRTRQEQHNNRNLSLHPNSHATYRSACIHAFTHEAFGFVVQDQDARCNGSNSRR